MTIEYKDSKRIVGLADVAGDSGWVTSDSTYINVNTTTEKIDWDLKNDNTDDHITYNLGTALSDTLWVFRCTFRFSTASGIAQFFAGMSSTGGAQNTTQDFIGTCILTGDNQLRSVDSDGATIPASGDNLASYSWASNTDYFLEIKRTSATAYSCTVRTGSHAGSTVATASGTCTSTTVGLQYILFANRVDSNGGSPDLTIDDILIDDGTSTYSSADYEFDFGVQANKPTNVQDNSIFVEKDTAKRYWFDVSKDTTKDGTNSNITLDTTNEKLGTGCYDFNGSTSRSVTSVKFNGLHDNTGGSISFWMRPRNMSSIHGNGDYIFDSMATSAANGTGISIAIKNTSLLRVNFTTSSNAWFTDINSTTTFSNNTWYHVVMTFGSNTVKLYINGSQEDTATFSNPNTNASNGNFVIGRHSTDPSSYGYYDGLLDDTGIWNRVLTSSEVTSLYNSGTGALASSISTTDFAGYYNYDAVTGDKLENEITTATWTQEFPVTSGLTIWYDFSDISTITKDSSNRISAVADKTSNGFDLVQATGGAQPLWVANDKNSLGVIDFAGSRYMASTFTSMSNATGYSIVLACVVPADNNTSMFSSTSPTSAKLRTYNTGTLTLDNSGSAITSPAISGLNGSWRTIVCIGNGSSSKVYIDGIDRTSGTVNFSENLVNWLVGAESTGGGYSNAKQGELIAYNRVLSATEISSLHNYLTGKWGL